jgi:hypothetical protein
MGILFSCCRKKRTPEGGEYKKVEAHTPDATIDLEAGGDDGEEWDDFPEDNIGGSGGGSGGTCGGAASHAVHVVEEPEPEPEPEPDYFAEIGGMAPKISPTKRHAAQSVFAKPAQPSSSRFAMNPDEEIAAGDGWGDGDDLGDFGVSEKRRAAKERSEARRKQREDTACRGSEKRSLKVAATRVQE